MQIVDPHPTDLADVFAQSPEVPEFQRSYSWNTRNVALLVASLLEQAEQAAEEKLFIGQIVAYDGAEKGKPYLGIIDGQQRLTTATIIAAVLRDELDAIESETARKAASTVNARLIWPTDYAGDQADNPYLTLNSYDVDYFLKRVQKRPNKQVTAQAYPSHSLIDAAYKETSKAISKALEAKTSQTSRSSYLIKLAETLGKQVNLIIVRGSDRDGASDLFEVLNDRAVQLTNVDLLKNFLAGRAGSKTAVAQVIKGLQPMFEIGTDREGIVDQFLRHFWISEHSDEKKGLYRVMRAELDAQIKSGKSAADLAHKFGEAAKKYGQLVDAETGHQGADSALRKVQIAQAFSLYPLLLSSLHKYTMPQLSDIADAALVLFTRWAIACRLDSSDLEKVLFTLAFQVTEGTVTPEVVIQRLRESSPTNAAFRTAMEEASIRKPAWRRYVLYCLEQQLRTDQGKEELKIDPSKCQVEHIYPQTPASGHWSKWPHHDEYINRLGNLTLLGQSINASLKNKAFAVKRVRYEEKSEIELTKDIAAEYTTWTRNQVRNRQVSLAALALNTWPLPE